MLNFLSKDDDLMMTRESETSEGSASDRKIVLRPASFLPRRYKYCDCEFVIALTASPPPRPITLIRIRIITPPSLTCIIRHFIVISG